MKVVETFTASIYVGLLERDTLILHTVDEARAVLRKYVDEVGLCVTLTATEYIYTNGGEPGIIVGLINYPRFPSKPEVIKAHALEIAGCLAWAFRQCRVSIVLPNETLMLEKLEAEQEISA